jgi:hypothetical protein
MALVTLSLSVVVMVAPLFYLAARSWIYGINFALLSVLGNNILFLPCSEILFTDTCSKVASMKYRLAMCGLNTLYQILNFGNFMKVVNTRKITPLSIL